MWYFVKVWQRSQYSGVQFHAFRHHVFGYSMRLLSK
jgi:hypothetical protein